MTKPNKYTDEQVAWLKDNQAGISRKELTERFNKRFKVSCSSSQISALCRRHGLRSGVNSGQLKKGDEPWNLGKTGYMGANVTSFKKGHKGNNTRPVGSERTCSKDGYVLVKTKEPRKWERKHLVEWRKHYGNLPQGYCLRFLDNDRTNCHISNLVCFSLFFHSYSLEKIYKKTKDKRDNRCPKFRVWNASKSSCNITYNLSKSKRPKKCDNKFHIYASFHYFLSAYSIVQIMTNFKFYI